MAIVLPHKIYFNIFEFFSIFIRPLLYDPPVFAHCKARQRLHHSSQQKKKLYPNLSCPPYPQYLAWSSRIQGLQRSLHMAISFRTYLATIKNCISTGTPQRTNNFCYKNSPKCRSALEISLPPIQQLPLIALSNQSFIHYTSTPVYSKWIPQSFSSPWSRSWPLSPRPPFRVSGSSHWPWSAPSWKILIFWSILVWVR